MTGRALRVRFQISVDFFNLDIRFMQLLLCMFVSHILINNPLFGAVVFLFTNIWSLYYSGNFSQINSKGNLSTTLWILLIATTIAGLSTIFLYPIVLHVPQANYVSLFVLMLVSRNILSEKMAPLKKADFRKILLHILIQSVFIACCVLFSIHLLNGINTYIVIAIFALCGMLLPFRRNTPETMYAHYREDILQDVSSYKIFKGMNFYSHTAFTLGIMMYFCYVSFSQTKFVINIYLLLALWLIGVLLWSAFFCQRLTRKKIALNINLFVIGALMWILGSIKMFNVSDFFRSTLWSLVWGVGMASIYAAMIRYNKDFYMVAQLDNKDVSRKELKYRSQLAQTAASIFSSCLIICVLGVWTFLLPKSENANIPRLFKEIMIQLPVLFMLIGCYLALKQPIDVRTRQKLQIFYVSKKKDYNIRQNLRRLFVQKYRVRFGVKIIAFFVRPFLHLKVNGKKHINYKQFPSIFICNHGVFYGPVAAVIYLPTYFRPWIDRKMLDRQMSADEMYSRIFFRLPLLSEKAKRRFSYRFAGLVTWALSSFNPIPVERDNLRNVMSTFQNTIDVLKEGDNVLIFPERPHKVSYDGVETVVHETETVGNLFTGFANIGKMYFKQSGKCLHFYPIYANKNTHTFNIGEAVVYQPDNAPNDEKQRIAGLLRERMLQLSTMKTPAKRRSSVS